MKSEIERQVVRLLQGGQAVERGDRAAMIRELGPEGLEVLRKIAAGQIEVEHPQLRLKAIAALGFDEMEAEASAQVLSDLVQEGPPRVAIVAVRALGRSPAGGREQFRALVRDPKTPPSVALAAARVAAATADEEVVGDLRDLRSRLRAYVERDDSPSLLSLDRLIAESRFGRGETKGPPPIA